MTTVQRAADDIFSPMRVRFAQDAKWIFDTLIELADVLGELEERFGGELLYIHSGLARLSRKISFQMASLDKMLMDKGISEERLEPKAVLAKYAEVKRLKDGMKSILSIALKMCGMPTNVQDTELDLTVLKDEYRNTNNYFAEREEITRHKRKVAVYFGENKSEDDLYSNQGRKELTDRIFQALLVGGEMTGSVDFSGLGRRGVTGNSLELAKKPVKLFISYAREDETFRKELEKHLKVLKRQNRVSIWHDRMILPGDAWNGRIASELDAADIILFIVSPDFLASDYIQEVEYKRALERNSDGSARLIPIIARPAAWEEILGDLQVLPSDGRPLEKWGNRDDAFLDVFRGINKVVEELASV